MKHILAIIGIALCAAGPCFSQEAAQRTDNGTTVAISGEIQTGLFWYDRKQYDTDGERFDHVKGSFIHNSADTNWAGGVTDYSSFKNQPGRFRLNF